jgi:hypothetical protein
MCVLHSTGDRQRAGAVGWRDVGVIADVRRDDLAPQRRADEQGKAGAGVP